MTEEELRKEATSTIEWESTPMIDRPLFIYGYITGAKSKENRIEELEAENAELRRSKILQIKGVDVALQRAKAIK